MRKGNDFRDFIGVSLMAAVLIAMILITGCATTSTPRPLSKQMLFIRDSNTGLLSHNVCLKKVWDKCKRWNRQTFDLNDKATRDTLINFGFVCKIGGRRFKIDPENAGFSRYGEGGVIEERIAFSSTRFLIDAGTFCYSEREYPEGLPI